MKSALKTILILLLFSTGILKGQKANWEIIGNMPVKLYGSEAVVVDSLIYVLGGYSDSLQAVVDWIYKYNPGTNVWSLAGHMKKRRINFVAGKIDNKIYYCGGEYYATYMANGVLESFDCNTSVTAVVDSNRKFNRISASGIINNSVFYIIGGRVYNPPMGQVPYIMEYSIPTKTFTYNYSGMSGIQEEQMTVPYKNNLYILGGIFNTVSADIRFYRTQNHQLMELHQGLISHRAEGRAVILPDTNQIVLMGGFNEGYHALNSVELYEIIDSIHIAGRIIAPLNFKRTNFCSVFFKGSVYAFGGEDDFERPVTQIEKLDFITSVNENGNQAPEGFTLNQNFPNPFNSSTIISYFVPKTSKISIKIYNVLGIEITELVNEEKQPGFYKASFKGINLTSGVYFYKIIASVNNGGAYSETRKMILLK